MLIPLGVYSQGRVEEVIYITQSTTKGIYTTDNGFTIEITTQ